VSQKGYAKLDFTPPQSPPIFLSPSLSLDISAVYQFLGKLDVCPVVVAKRATSLCCWAIKRSLTPSNVTGQKAFPTESGRSFHRFFFWHQLQGRNKATHIIDSLISRDR